MYVVCIMYVRMCYMYMCIRMCICMCIRIHVCGICMLYVFVIHCS